MLPVLLHAGKNFTEGWVEFEDKAIAKSVAAGLNGQQIGGKRRSAYHFDLWCMKYLPKFKWDHLTEEIAYEKVGAEMVAGGATAWQYCPPLSCSVKGD
jgi:ESF2/ABP1 family protein